MGRLRTNLHSQADRRIEPTQGQRPAVLRGHGLVFVATCAAVFFARPGPDPASLSLDYMAYGVEELKPRGTIGRDGQVK